jgi:DNA-binding response OmpR family regulator
VIRELRRRSEAPLVVIDGGDDVAQLNLEAGADHWLTKPFVPGVLVGALTARPVRSPGPVQFLLPVSKPLTIVAEPALEMAGLQAQLGPAHHQLAELDQLSVDPNPVRRVLGSRAALSGERVERLNLRLLHLWLSTAMV